MPFIDTNPKGNGYYTLKRAAVRDHHLAVRLPDPVGRADLLRHVPARPELDFFGPYEFWDPHKAEALNNVDVSNVFWNMHPGPRPADGRTTTRSPLLPHWLVREWLGLRAGRRLPVRRCRSILRFTVFRRMYEHMGAIRYVDHGHRCCCSWR